jgi:hypothetical protein
VLPVREAQDEAEISRKVAGFFLRVMPANTIPPAGR